MVNPPGSLIPNYPTATAGFDPIATSGTQTYTIPSTTSARRTPATSACATHCPPARVPGRGAGRQRTGSPAATTAPRPAASSTCIGGHILGHEERVLHPTPPGRRRASGNQFATIIIKLFATPVRPAGDAQRGARRPAERDRRGQREQQHRVRGHGGHRPATAPVRALQPADHRQDRDPRASRPAASSPTERDDREHRDRPRGQRDLPGRASRRHRIHLGQRQQPRPYTSSRARQRPVWSPASVRP